MAAQIHVTPEEMWRFFKCNRSRLEKSQIKVAEDENAGITVYLTEECGYPGFYVYTEDGDCVYEEMAVNSSDCEFVASEIFDEYLSVKITTSDGKMISRKQAEDLIYEKEDALYLALVDFLDVILGVDYRTKTLTEDDVNKVLDHIAEYLSSEMDLAIDRPMILNDETTGEDVFYRFPYEEFTFDA